MRDRAYAHEPSFMWKDAYATGVVEIDEQHRHLLELANLVQLAVQTGQDEEIVDPAIEALTAYAQRHFQDEEKALANACSSDLERITAEHETLSQEISDLALDRDLGFDKAFSERLASWVEKRLIPHMIHSDREAFALGIVNLLAQPAVTQSR